MIIIDINDLIGQKFGRLTVLKAVKGKKRMELLCECECEKHTIIQVQKSGLLSGNTKSCGCYFLEKTKEKGKNLKHGMKDTRFYNIWNKLKSRCICESSKDYKRYGGRGIKICDNWLDFENFKTDMYETYLEHCDIYGEKNTTIERIDVNGNYEVDNCKWATNKEQANNRTNNVNIEFNNQTHTIAEWSEILNVNYDLIYDRIIIRKWDIEKALTTPPKNMCNKIEYNGGVYSIAKLSKIIKIGKHIIDKELKNGLSIYEIENKYKSE